MPVRRVAKRGLLLLIWNRTAIPILVLLISISQLLPAAFAQDSDVSEPPAELLNNIDVKQARSEAEQWLPDSALLYVQLSPVEHWINHPLRSWITDSEPFQKIWKSKDVLNARSGLAVAEIAMGMKLEVFLKRLTAGGLYAAFDPETEGIVILTRTKDEKWLNRTLTKALEFAKQSQGQDNDGRTLKSAEYRGIQGYGIDKNVFAAIGPWLMVTNKQELAKRVIDRHLDGSDSSLSDAPWRNSATYGPLMVVDAQKVMPGQTIATLEMDLAKARELFSSNDLFRKQAKDFGAELLLGGVLALLQNAPSMSMELNLEPTGVSTEVSFPTEVAWFAESREHYVGPEAQGRALPLIEVDGALASLSTYRNLSELWQRAGDLFDQRVNDELAQADNTLTTLFSGKDFGSDILGAIEPEIRIVSVPQTWSNDRPKPSIELPAFVLVAQLKDPELMRKELKRIFQSFVGFLNIVGAMEGQPQLDLMSDTTEHGPIYWSEYVVDADRSYENGLPIQYNFSPAIAFKGEQVILSSSRVLAGKMLNSDLSSSALSKGGENPTNTVLEIQADAVYKALEGNREALIAQNMLEKGHSRAEAEGEIDTLMNLLGLFEKAGMEMSFGSRSSIKVDVDYRQP